MQMFSFDGNAVAADVSQIAVFTRVPPMIKAVQAIFVGDEISVPGGVDTSFSFDKYIFNAVL